MWDIISSHVFVAEHDLCELIDTSAGTTITI